MMQIYNVGPDELDYEDSNAVWIVYHYEGGMYDGSGEAVALGLDGKLRIIGLGHCSCYGPFDEGISAGDIVEVEEFLKENDSVHGYVSYDSLENKVRELLSQN